MTKTAIAPLTLIVASALMVLAMSHHPVAHGDNFASMVVDMARQATMDRIVHGALIALIAAALLSFVEFSARLGLTNGIVRTALVAYGIGACAMFGAGLIDGFAVSWLAERYATASPAGIDAFRHLVRLAEVGGVQSLAGFGCIGMSIGVIFWSVALLKAPAPHRGLASIGFVAGILVAVGMLTGLLSLQAPGMMLILVCQAIWNVAVAVEWLRGRFAT